MGIYTGWVIDGTKVITPNGYGSIVGSGCGCTVFLNEPIGGEHRHHYQNGQIALDTPYAVVRVISLTAVIATLAINCPTWAEATDLVSGCYAAEDETLLGINLEDGRFVMNRLLPYEGYMIVKAGYDRHYVQSKPLSNELEKEEADLQWARVARTTGTIGSLEMAAYIDVAEQRVLRWALFSKGEVLAIREIE